MTPSAATARAAVTPAVSRFAARNAAAPTPLEQAVFRAVTYAAVFDYPLLPSEVCRTLVRVVCREEAVLACYRGSPFLQCRVTYHRGYFVPAGREGLVDTRAGREARSLAVIAAHRRVLDLVAAMPFVRLAAVSGSLAHLNAGRQADVDLFLVTAPRRVWVVTLALVVAAKLLGRRRSLCVNYVVDETALAVPHGDEFSANQLMHLRPFAGHAMYRRLIAANRFVTETYPNFQPGESAAFPFTPAPWTAPLARRLERWFEGPARVAETLTRRVYGAYLRRQARRWPSPEGVELSPSVLKLHGRSHRRGIARAFQSALEAGVTSRAGALPGSSSTHAG